MKQKKISTPEELKFLEIKLDVLIDEYQNVKVENASLQTKQDTLVREKANLLFKTNALPDNFKCTKYPDYRINKTPLSEMNVSYNCSNC